MAMLRRLAGVVTLILGCVTVISGTATAMTVDSPKGTLINGWYKDSFSITVHYGDGSCIGPGTVYSATYYSSSAYEGSHQYYFMSDTPDNPYYVIDAVPPPQPLVSPLPCPGSTLSAFLPNQQFTLALDSQPPSVSITSPASGTVTDQTQVTVSGIATDAASGVQSVQLFVNGVAKQYANPIGNTYGMVANLAFGKNTIQVQATDNVGHTGVSNTITVTLVSSTSGGGGASSGSGNSSGTSAGPSGTSSGSASLKFLNGAPITVSNSGLDKPSDPAVVLAETGFPNVNVWLLGTLITIAIILLVLNALVIWRFRPVFARLDRGNSGLRRRIVVIVTLPSLLPVFGIGFLAYQQLSTSLKAALSQELARAAQTSAIKLDREFAMRQNVAVVNAGDILQIKSQFKTQYAQLASQKDACATQMKSAIPYKKFSLVASDENCIPFISAIAQLAGASSISMNQYLQALDASYNNTLKVMEADEQQRTDSLLAAIRAYFPDTTELALIDTASPANIVATLPASDGTHPVTADHKDLLTKASATSTMLFDNHHHPAQALFIYPVTDSSHNIAGNVVVAYSTEYSAFVPAIWQATPKPYAQDQAYIVSGSGQQIYPSDGAQLPAAQARRLAAAGAGSLVSAVVGKQTYATRVSQVTGTDWAVAVGAPPASILAPVASIQRVALLAIVSFLLLSLLLGIVFVSGVATEIEALYQGAIRFAKGELDYAIDLPARDELRALGDTMNKMAVDIKTAQTALVEKDKEFINITSHELKAPMTAILGNLSMIMEDGMGTVDETARRLIEQAYSGTQRLKALVTDLLDVARLEAGKAQFTIVPLDVSKLVQDIIAMQAVPAQQAKVTLKYQPSRLPQVLADDSKLQIVITNFISNAIKYNRPDGTVTVTHEVKGGSLVTSVADTGLGIPADQQQHIFEKYYRVQHADRASVPGTGLGMYITKRFIEAMGGTVWFESVHGKGTTFSFTLPLQKSDA